MHASLLRGLLLDESSNRLECPCHQGFFSIADGAVLQGPPRRPLPRVVLERRGDELVAIRMEGGGAMNAERRRRTAD